VSDLVKTPWGDPRSYVCDDARGIDAGTGDEVHQLTISQGGNGDWYVAVLPEGHRIGPSVRLRTSGGASTGCPGLTIAIADAYRALGGEQVKHDDEAASFRAMLQGFGCGNDESEELVALRQEVTALRAEVESYRNPPPDRGRLIVAAISRGESVCQLKSRVAALRANPKTKLADSLKADAALALAIERKAEADAALAAIGGAHGTLPQHVQPAAARATLRA
jgi:hypothetical protein